jgi:hypothetical protein
LPSPPAELLALENDRGHGWLLSAGAGPAAGLVQVGAALFGATAFAEPADLDSVLVTCELWVKESAGLWTWIGEFGASYRAAPFSSATGPRVFVSGGLDYETEGGDERFILCVSGHLGEGGRATMMVDDAEAARIEGADDRRFFCVVVAVPPVEDGIAPTISIQSAI